MRAYGSASMKNNELNTSGYDSYAMNTSTPIWSWTQAKSHPIIG